MPRDNAVEVQRTAILRDELARTRARLDQARKERDDLAVRLDELLGLLVRRRALSESAAVRFLRDFGVVLPGATAVPSGRTGGIRLRGSDHGTHTPSEGTS